MTEAASREEDKELRRHVLRYMECAARRLECRSDGALDAEMRSIRAVTGLAHAELLARGAEVLLDGPD